MDDLDQALIALLRKNARASVSELSASLGVSRGTVANRIRRLELTRVVQGYTLKLRPDAELDVVRAWMCIQVEGVHTRKVIAILMGEPGVDAIHDTNGRWDLLAELRVASMAELAQVLDRIRMIKGIHGTETSIHLATFR
ncbi:Lrp/AsnC family transcriptional regulator [Paracoccus benzoatiresistens]|uniref:Lrp/AsnC family transcriptional regulator n=1 Tax=Paracoccus benzoatiresistens TaxID=2997341 RepID=A0ABT4JA05_9RHOB|nr:Lrp/AsnC family transcriptional regulator [Paracoccus sp. EF6]MCZ0963916.1 Lrp/AsnC family transcriptional regulator [Paracoccus sp. EF6]